MRCAALRFFTVYGPRQRPEMAITLFMRAALAGQPITVFGDGSMRRDFTHVDDIVRGVLAALDATGPPGFRAYNLGSGAPVDLAGLVDAIAVTAGVALRVETRRSRSATSTRRSRTSPALATSSGGRRASRCARGSRPCSPGSRAPLDPPPQPQNGSRRGAACRPPATERFVAQLPMRGACALASSVLAGRRWPPR